MTRTWTIAIATQVWTNLDRKAIRAMVDYGAAHRNFHFRDIIFTEDEEVPKKVARLNCDGAIINMMRVVYEEIADEFPDVPMVNIGSDVLSDTIPSVCAMRGVSTKKLLAHLRQQGYERFAYVGPEPVGQENYRAGLLRVLLKADQQSFAEYCLPGFDYHGEPTPHMHDLCAWLKQLPEPELPLGIICYDAYRASAVVAACRNLGMTIPKQVGIASYIEEQGCLTVDPAITSVEAPSYELGHTAMKLMHQILQGEPVEPRRYEVGEPMVIIRGSSASIASAENDIGLAVRFMEQHVEDHITIDDCLAHIGTMSRATFYRSFCKQMGVPPAEYLRTLKIKRAKELLTTTPLTVTRIAGLCGFSNLTQFGDTFKRQVGQTPRQYRETMTAALQQGATSGAG